MTAVRVHCRLSFMLETVRYAGELLQPGREGKMEQFDQRDRETAGLWERPVGGRGPASDDGRGVQPQPGDGGGGDALFVEAGPIRNYLKTNCLHRKPLVADGSRWIPACAGMTSRGAGMTSRGAGMTSRGAGIGYGPGATYGNENRGTPSP